MSELYYGSSALGLPGDYSSQNGSQVEKVARFCEGAVFYFQGTGLDIECFLEFIEWFHKYVFLPTPPRTFVSSVIA